MAARRGSWLAGWLFLVAWPALAQTPEPPPSARARELRSLIEALGAEDWGVREAARQQLLKIGPEALPWLQRAAVDRDAQRASAARELLDALRWMVPEGLRPALGEALDDFPGQPRGKRLAALDQLAEHGREAPALAAPFLVTVARFDPDAEVRLKAVRLYLALVPEPNAELDPQVLEALADERQDSAELATDRAVLLVRLERPQEALVQARAAFQAGPTRERFLLLVDLLLACSGAEEAVPLLEQAVARAPDDLELGIRQGEALLAVGRQEEGLARLQALVERAADKADPPLVRRLGEALIRVGQLDLTERLYRKALSKNISDRLLRLAQGDLWLARGDTVQALRIYLNELRYGADGAVGEALRQRVGQVFARRGAPEAAEDPALLEDLALGRDVYAVRLAAGRWLLERGLVQDARRELALAAALQPDQLETLLLLGDACRAAGDAEQAAAAWRQAAELDPESELPPARLEELAARPPSAPEAAASFTAWERRLTPEALAAGPEAVPGLAPPPRVLGERVVLVPPGNAEVLGLDAATGELLWRYAPPAPEPEEGALPEQLGLELAALLPLSPGVVARSHPARALQRAPLLGVLANVYWRPASRTWNAARFQGLRLIVVDPLQGEELARIDLEGLAQVVAPAPVSQRGRALVVLAPSSRRRELAALDLVQGKTLWRAALPGRALRAPVFLTERARVAAVWGEGVQALEADGASGWRYARLEPDQPEGGAAAISCDPVRAGDGALLLGLSDGGVLRLDPRDGSPAPVWPLAEQAVTGLVAVGEHLFLAERGGRVQAFHLEAGGPRRLWAETPSRAAARRLCWAGGVLFAPSGAEDLFADEAPGLLALDPASGAVRMQRGLTRHSLLGAGEALLVVVDGGRGTTGGLTALGLRPGQPLEPGQVRQERLRGATREALNAGQLELAALVARRLLRERGGEPPPREDLALVARALARSGRAGQAEQLILEAESRGARGEEPWWDALRAELGLAVPTVPELTPVPADPASPAPGGEPPPSGQEGPDERSEPGEAPR